MSKKKPLFGRRRTAKGRQERIGTVVMNSDGEVSVLLTPAGKGTKAAFELREGVKVTNDGTVKMDNNGNPLKLTAKGRAWRAGYLAARKDNAKIYNRKKAQRNGGKNTRHSNNTSIIVIDD